ncbi:hypothetical protein [uncultured Selenomonas sp.]|nr:hypothetical protein [uncultured Selenomonas sp.]
MAEFISDSLSQILREPLISQAFAQQHIAQPFASKDTPRCAA